MNLSCSLIIASHSERNDATMSRAPSRPFSERGGDETETLSSKCKLAGTTNDGGQAIERNRKILHAFLVRRLSGSSQLVRTFVYLLVQNDESNATISKISRLKIISKSKVSKIANSIVAFRFITFRFVRAVDFSTDSI